MEGLEVRIACVRVCVCVCEMKWRSGELTQLDLNLVLRRDWIQLELVIWGSSLYSWYVSLLDYVLSRQSDTPKPGGRGRGMSMSLRPASGIHSQTLLTTTTTTKRCIYLGAEAGKEEYREHSLPWSSLGSERNECLESHPS